MNKALVVIYSAIGLDAVGIGLIFPCLLYTSDAADK